MADIAYVCLSDLHFGAANSLLTSLNYDTLKVEPQTAPAVLEALVECLATILPREPKPALVLNGDIFELALADDEQAIMAFERFVELAFEQRDLFSRVVYLPGNHDHHLWETAREAQYQRYLRGLQPAQAPRAPWHTTPLCSAVVENVPLAPPLLQAIFSRRHIDKAVEVRYPNFGLFRDGGRRAVVFHHGHFIEPIYSAMAIAQDSVLGPARENTVEVWEARNFAWIDFVWSTLGRSGDVGDNVAYVYDMLQDRQAIRLMADRLLVVTLPLAVKNGLVRWLARMYLRGRIARAVSGLERRTPAAPLSAGGRKGLHRYLEGPLAAQLIQHHVRMPEETTFVFGHTHKPFQHVELFDGYPQDVRLYNSGGWVVDTTRADVRQGAAVVFVDDDLHTASLHMYQQHQGTRIAGIAVEAVDRLANPLFARLEQDVHPNALPWKRFTAEVERGVPRRHEALGRIIASGKKALERRG